MSGVDVLAVLDVYCARAGNEPTADVVKVRAVVVDLVNAAVDAAELLESVAPHHPQAANLRAALVRCRRGAA